MHQLAPLEAHRIIAERPHQLVDVREDFEVRLCSLEGAVHIPLAKLLSGGDESLRPEVPVICYCHSGYRSQRAAQYLLRRGFKEVHNLAGGIHAWSLQVDPSVPTY